MRWRSQGNWRLGRWVVCSAFAAIDRSTKPPSPPTTGLPIASVRPPRYLSAALVGPVTAWTRFMSFLLVGRTAVLLVVALTGCGIVGARKDVPRSGSAAADRGAIGRSNELALAGSAREPPLADPSTMIPPPPRMDLVPDIPPAPPKDDQFVNISTAPTKKSGQHPAPGVVSPENALVMANARERTIPGAGELNLDALRRIHDRAAERF